jgi:hypothetical protein
METEGSSEPVSYSFHERKNSKDPFFSLWQFKITQKSEDNDSITLEEDLLPRSTFHVPDGDEHDISILIAGHYTVNRAPSKWLPRPKRKDTIGWRNFYHDMLIRMPVDWPEGDHRLRPLEFTMLLSDSTSEGRFFAGFLFSCNLYILCSRYVPNQRV